MDCSEYLEHASEFLDGRVEEGRARELEAHLSQCPRCRQYRTILEEGLHLVQSLPAVDLPADFRSRLKHRIFHIEDGAAIARESLGSGAATAAVLSMTILMVLAAWAPLMGGDVPALELPAVVVARPPAETFTPTPRAPTFSRGLSFFTTADFQEGVWGDTHQILFEYSSLSQRRRGTFLSRVGLQ